MNTYILYVVRLMFLGLVVFETANLFEILHFDLDFSWIGLILTCLFVWGILEIIQFLYKRQTGKTLPSFILIVPTLNIFIDALGDILKFYSKFIWYDQLAHFLGGAATAGMLFFVIRIYINSKNIALGKKFIGVFSIFGTAFFASMYEIEEYAETFFLHNNRLGDRLDTPNDILLTLVGGVVGSLITIIILKLRYKKIMGR